jgi:hypothetical protein
MKTSSLLLLGTSLLVAPLARAQDKNPLREKMQALEEKAREAKAQGRADEAREIIQQIHRLKEEAGKHEGTHERKEKAPAQKMELSGDGERRQHVLEAIKHLHAAGLHEPAERIEQMLHESHDRPRTAENPAAREMQQQLQRAMRDMQEQTQRALRETHEQMGKMARAIEELREQVARK